MNKNNSLFMFQEKEDEYLEKETSIEEMEEEFKEFFKENFILSEEPAKERFRNALVNIKNAKKYLDNNPNKAFTGFIKKTLRLGTYLFATSVSGTVGMALGGPLVSLISVVTTAALSSKMEEKACRKQNDQLYFFYEDNIGWLDEKIEASEDEKEKRQLMMLRSKYKSNLLRLKTPEKMNKNKSSLNN